jgi:hypothetical protein
MAENRPAFVDRKDFHELRRARPMGGLKEPDPPGADVLLKNASAIRHDTIIRTTVAA